MHVVLDVLPEVVLDTLKLMPFLFLSFLFLEYLEHKAGDGLSKSVRRAGAYGPVLGAVLGIIPQCGFSAACAQLFNSGLISAGTMAAVFVSTSDEAIPLMLSHADHIGMIVLLIGLKALLGVIFGFLLDLCWSKTKQQQYFRLRGHHHECGVREDGGLWDILLEGFKRTLEVLLYVFLISLIVEALVEAIGTERMGRLLLSGPFQPFVAGLLGFLPGCAPSVLLTELYLGRMISFGSVVSGLCTGAGMGLLLLLKGKHTIKVYLIILGGMYAFSTLMGTVLQLVIGV